MIYFEHRPAKVLKDPETGENIEVFPENFLAGIEELMGTCEHVNGRAALDERGELCQIC